MSGLHCSISNLQGSRFRMFFCFLMLGIFGILGSKMVPKGPGRASKGSGEAFRFIWTKFQPKWAHLGSIQAPFCFLISQRPILGPNSSKSIIPNEVLGPWDPGWGERAAPGGRRPTFRRGVGGRSPPTATQGVWGGGSPPLELLQIAKSETLRGREMEVGHEF